MDRALATCYAVVADFNDLVGIVGGIGALSRCPACGLSTIDAPFDLDFPLPQGLPDISQTDLGAWILSKRFAGALPDQSSVTPIGNGAYHLLRPAITIRVNEQACRLDRHDFCWECARFGSSPRPADMAIDRAPTVQEGLAVTDVSFGHARSKYAVLRPRLLAEASLADDLGRRFSSFEAIEKVEVFPRVPLPSKQPIRSRRPSG